MEAESTSDAESRSKLLSAAKLLADATTKMVEAAKVCLLYTSDAADDLTRVDLGGRRIIKKS